MGRIKKEKQFSYNAKILILAIFPLICLFVSTTFGKGQVLDGFVKIIKTQGLLITDFIYIGGLYSNFFNIACVGMINLLIIFLLRIPINGTVFAAYFLSIGFSSFGKTILNILPIYIGGILYCKYEKIIFKNIFAILMLSTGLAPVISFFFFSEDISFMYRVVLGLLSGVIIGFIMPILSSHMIKFHDGYNLYNVGFTAGIVGTLFTAIIKGKGITINIYYNISNEYDFYLKILLVFFFSFFVMLGYFINQNSFKGYDQLLSSSGRLVTDYILSEGFGITLLNCGILGILSVALTSFIGADLNGPLIAGIFSVFGFGALGKNPLNCIPIVIGVILAGYLKIFNFDSFNIALTALFGTTLAPISGVFGSFAGILAGFLHFFIVNNIGVIHGGMNLYNNGFSGGIVAGILVPLISKFESKEREKNALCKKNY